MKTLFREYDPAGHVPRQWLIWPVRAIHSLRQTGSRIGICGMGSMCVSTRLSAQSKMNFILSITFYRPEFPMSSMWDVLFRLGPRLHWECVRVFPQFLQKNAGIVPHIRPRPLPSTSCSIPYSLIITLFHAIQPELLTASWNKYIPALISPIPHHSCGMQERMYTISNECENYRHVYNRIYQFNDENVDYLTT
jgi:hypothetical protein